MGWLDPNDERNYDRPSVKPTENTATAAAQRNDSDRETAVHENGLNPKPLPKDIGKASDDAKDIAG